MKMSELPTTDRKGRKLEPIENGLIEHVSISNEDHGCLTAWVSIKFGRVAGCNFGGFKIGDADADGGNLDNKNYAADWIVKCLEVGGVHRWEDLKGRPVRVLHEGIGGQIVAIGHYIEDKWFCPRVEYKDK